MQAANDLYQTINQNPNDNIKLITIGANSKIKPKENLPFPSSKYPTPKCSKDDTYQANAYHMQQHLLTSNLNYETLRYDIKTPIYTDSRLKIERLIVDNENISDCIKLIERINNKLMFENIININDIFIYNEDWYILLKEDGNIISNCLEIDPRAKEEFDSIKASISSKDSAKIYIKK